MMQGSGLLDPSYNAGDWTLIIFDKEAVDYLSVGDLSITYCFDGDICPDFTVTTPVPETPEPEMCTDTATLFTPSALGFCGEDISVSGKLSPISRFYLFEAALNLTKALDLEIVILAPDGVFYTVISGEEGNTQMGDELEILSPTHLHQQGCHSVQLCWALDLMGVLSVSTLLQCTKHLNGLDLKIREIGSLCSLILRE